MKSPFYSILPASVRHDVRLSDKAKLVYAELSAMLNEDVSVGKDSDLYEHLSICFEISLTEAKACLLQLESYNHLFINRGVIYFKGC